MFRSHAKGCHYQILYAEMEAPSVEHQWVETHKDRILEDAKEAMRDAAREASEQAAKEEQESEHEDVVDVVEGLRQGLRTPPDEKRRWGSEVSSGVEEGTPVATRAKAKGAQSDAKRRRQSSKGAQGGAKGAQGGAQGAVVPRWPHARPAPQRRSAGGASSSGSWAGAASSSGPMGPVVAGALSDQEVRAWIQRSVDIYMALDGNRKHPRFKTIANCAAPTLIWWTHDVELWLGGTQNLWDSRLIPQYTTADRVPKGGSIGLMGRD